MSDNPTEDLRQRLVNEMTDAPQGKRDAQMPPSPNAFGGEIGPDPGDATLPLVDMSDSTGAGDSRETGEEDDPGVADAGGVNSPDADGSTRTGA